MSNLKIFLAVLLGTLGPGLVIGLVGYAAIKAVRRNPSAAKRILTSMVITFIFVEAMVALAFIMIHILFK